MARRLARSITWDTKDRITSITDELNRVTSFTYDALDRLLTLTQPDPDGAGPLTAPVWTWTWDDVGNRLTETNPAGWVTAYAYSNRNWLTSITLPDPDGTGPLASPVLSRGYNTAGWLTSQTDALGQQTSFSYDNAGRLTSVTQPDPDGAGPLTAPVLGYQHDNLGRITRAADPLNHYTYVQYDARNRLTQRTDPDPDAAGPLAAPATTFAYTAAGELASVTDPLGRVTSFVYDVGGRQTTATLPDPDGAGPLASPVYTTNYDNLGRVKNTVDPLGNVTAFTWDVNSRLTHRTDPDPDGAGSLVSPVTQWTYDAAGQITSQTDPLGRVTSWAYDYLGRVTSTTLPDPDGGGPLTAPVSTWTYDVLGNVLTATDALGNVTAYQYDRLSRLTQETQADPDGAGPQTSPVTSWTYNANSQVTSVIDPLGRTTSYTHDNLGRLTLTTLPDPDGAGPLTSPTYAAAYNAASLVTSTTDPLGNVTSYQYDDLNRLKQRTDADPDGAGPLTSPVTTWTYDVASQLTSVTDPLGRAVNYSYDSLGRVTAATLPDPDGAGPLTSPVYSTSYDAVGNILTQTDPLGNVTSYVYDKLYRLLSRTDPDPDGVGPLTSPVTRWSYDIASQVTSTTDPTDQITTYLHDNLGRVIQTTTPDPDGAGPLSAAVYSTSYDAVGNVLSETDPLNKTTAYSYDKLHRLTTVTDVNNGLTRYAYDAVDNLVSLTDPGGNVTSWVYDNLDRATSETNALSGVRSWVYDAAGNVTKATDRNSRVREYAYDALQRLVTERWMSGQTAIRTFSFTFDAASQLTNVSDPDSAYAYTYDNLGRVTSASNAGTPGVPSVLLTMAYDASGYRTSLAARIGTTNDFLNTYQYDTLGRLTRITQDDQAGGNTVTEKRIDLSYNALGQYSQVKRYADVAATDLVATSTYTFDSAWRLTNLAHTQNATTLAQYTWVFDTAGRLTSESSPDGSVAYIYDHLGQLTGADRSSGPDETYTYDANGNRTNAGYVTGTNNRLTSDGTYTYQYDAEGNRTKKTTIATGDYVEYAWDYRNRLTSVTYRTAAHVRTKEVFYVYDVFDRRIQKNVDDNGTIDRGERYVYDESGGLEPVLFVFDGSGALISRHLYGQAVDEFFASETAAGTVLWNLPDHQGTVRDIAKFDPVTDVTSIVNHVKYTAFGEVLSQTDPATGTTPTNAAYLLSTVRVSYTAREWDADAALFYYRARWYDPRVGRFISEDPLSFNAGDVNLQRYVGNTPSLYVDPSGLVIENGNGIGVQAGGILGNIQGLANAAAGFAGGVIEVVQPALETAIAGIQDCAISIGRQGIAELNGFALNPLAVIGGYFQGMGEGALSLGRGGVYFGKEIGLSIWNYGNIGADGIAMFFLKIDSKYEPQSQMARSFDLAGWHSVAWTTTERASDIAGSAFSLGTMNIAHGLYHYFQTGDVDQLGRDMAPVPFGNLLAAKVRAEMVAARAGVQNCFLPGTQVLTDHGPKSIEHVRLGERVWAYSFPSDSWELCPAEERHEALYEGPVVTVETTWGTFECTAFHPVWVAEGANLDARPAFPEKLAEPDESHTLPGRWVSSHDIREGDRLVLRSGERAEVIRATVEECRTTVYNLSVERLHTFAVSSAGILVHNTGASIQANKAIGDAWEHQILTNKLPKTQSQIQPQITVKSNGPSGKVVRLDAVGTENGTGVIKLSDGKASASAPLTPNQKIVYPEMEAHGGVVLGKGKPPYVGGTTIPPTKVDILRP